LSVVGDGCGGDSAEYPGGVEYDHGGFIKEFEGSASFIGTYVIGSFLQVFGADVGY